MGPFYCPGDQKLYLDFAFFQELKNEFKAPGDFAQAYVIAHEVAHHVQNLLGTMDKFERAGPDNRSSVALNFRPIAMPASGAFTLIKEEMSRSATPKKRSVRPICRR